jgi:hypothetical protein
MKELPTISRNRSDAFNDVIFIDKMFAVLTEKGVPVSYGDYISKVYKNGHIKVLKSLGLYKTVGRADNKKVLVHPMVDLVIRTTIASNEEISRTIIDLVNGKFVGIQEFDIDLSEFDKLEVSPAKKEPGNYATYIAYNPCNGLHKIGRSKNVFNRLAYLQNEYTKEVSLIAFCDKDLEAEIHFEYRGKRVFSEWFNLTTDDLLDIFNRYNFKQLLYK